VLKSRNLTAGSLLGFDSSLLTHSRKNNDVWKNMMLVYLPLQIPIQVAKLTGVFLFGGEKLVDLLANFSLGNLDIVLGLTIIGHQGEETIIRNIELLFVSEDPYY
jgi:hypothetical protein